MGKSIHVHTVHLWDTDFAMEFWKGLIRGELKDGDTGNVIKAQAFVNIIYS